MRGDCELAVLTRSAHGSLIVTDGATIAVAAAPVAKVVDTTGAGDLYAAGFPLRPHTQAFACRSAARSAASPPPR